MSVITKCLHRNEKPDAYLDWPGSEHLEKSSYKWSEIVRPNIALEPDQIYKIIILKVNKERTNGTCFEINYQFYKMEIKCIFSDYSVVYKIDTIGVGYKLFEASNDFFLEIMLLAR